MATDIKKSLREIGHEADAAIRNIINQPIGLVKKYYHYTAGMVDKGQTIKKGKVDIIRSDKGPMVNIDYDNSKAWFNNDRKKMEYQNDYVEYAGQMYGEFTVAKNTSIMDKYFKYNTKTISGITFSDFMREQGTSIDYPSVAVVKEHVDKNEYKVQKATPHSESDENNDTYTGMINAPLANLHLRRKKRAKDKINKENPNITKGVYDSKKWNFFSSSVGFTKFGNFKSIGVIDELSKLSEKTQSFYVASMKGYALDIDVNRAEFIESIDDFLNSNDNTAITGHYAPNGNTYLDLICYSVNLEDGKRYNLSYVGNTTMPSANLLYTYAEAEGNKGASPLTIPQKTWNEGVRMGTFSAYYQSNLEKRRDLLAKTNQDFLDAKNKTLIARFHTDAVSMSDITSSAVSEYGMSRGRNLLVPKNSENIRTNGYDNPYCRVWTFHNQYSKLQDTIRPFDATTRKKIVHQELINYGVKGSNGLVRFSPLNNEGNNEIKKCMFSIENLAWKDEQGTKGPNGGRIMWFPPYDLKFNENVTANWGEVEFIGRGERIYTYTNTDRGGSLSFKLLIDHPSYIHNFTDDSLGTEDINSNENRLLRFFAGCDFNAEYIKKEKKENEVVIQDDPNTPPEGCKSINFKVYFPNNFSGVDVTPKYAVEYLLNGMGGNVYDIEEEEDVTEINISGIYQIKDGSTNYEVLKDGTIIPIFNNHKSLYGGYEMRGDEKMGISGDIEFKSWKEYDEAKKKEEVVDDTTSIEVIEFSDSNWPVRTLSVSSIHYDTEKGWGYLIDKEYANEKLKYRMNYADKSSYQLNDVGYKKGILESEINENVFWCSFSEFYQAMTENTIGGIEPTDNVDTIKELLHKIVQNGQLVRIDAVGYASAQGHNNNNLTLANNRAQTVKSWLQDELKLSPLYGYKVYLNRPSQKANAIDNNHIDVKKLKSATVKIFYREENLEVAKESPIQNNEEGVSQTEVYPGDNVANVDPRVLKLVKETIDWSQDKPKKNGINIVPAPKPARNTSIPNKQTTTDWDANILSRFNTPKTKFSQDDSKPTIVINSYEDEEYVIKSVVKADPFGLTNQMVDNSYDDKTTFKTSYSDGEVGTFDDNFRNNKYNEYNEYSYFEELKSDQPFLHKRIVEKIKYFDPAFHSITPEGFQARLTFLHQCTRQGGTKSSSDINTSTTADNLSFGRPPICVLRIGDFYNTRIIIKSLNIKYDQAPWDLNDEGIGVMPMMADIDINFVFIGGSDLQGPIARLQNAVSFNYYANTHVYDKRAEQKK